MSTRTTLLDSISRLEKITNGNKWSRFTYSPFRYFFGIFFREFIYKFSRKPIVTQAHLFTNQDLQIAIPSAIDLYIFGIKTHASEISLAKFIIKNLNKGDHFLDIGAHYGFFSLLATQLVGSKGKILAFEPSTATYNLLAKNTAPYPQISALNQCVSNNNEALTFYEFPTLFSEYNSIEKGQYEHEGWYQRFKPTQTVKMATYIDELVNTEFMPQMIKIDVEGAEIKVIQGGLNYFKESSPIVIMEFIWEKRFSYKEAVLSLCQLSYTINIILETGNLKTMSWESLNTHMKSKMIDSENLVFIKTT